MVAWGIDSQKIFLNEIISTSLLHTFDVIVTLQIQNSCGVGLWEWVRVGFQVSRREFHTHIRT